LSGGAPTGIVREAPTRELHSCVQHLWQYFGRGLTCVTKTADSSRWTSWCWRFLNSSRLAHRLKTCPP